MLKIDYGSGYNPKKGYKTCDITFSPFLDFVSMDNKIFDKKGEIKSNSVSRIYCRNVLHHIENLEDLLSNFYRYLKKGGIIEIIDIKKEYFYSNFILDNVWYRYIIPNDKIFISTKYRDYISLAKNIGFIIMQKKISYIEKERYFLIKK